MNEENEPDWLAELAKGGEALRRQIEPIVQAAGQFVLDARRTTMSGGPVPPFQQRVIRAVDAAMRELLPPEQPNIRYGSFRGYGSLGGVVAGTASLAGVGTLTGTGSVALPPMKVAGQMTVDDRPRGLATLSDGERVALVLVWLYAVWLPWVGSRLPPELHGMLSDSLATFAIALAITWRIRDRHR